MTSHHTPDTREEAASKLPALHVLMVMGWAYLPPAEALEMRGSERSVLLVPVLREWLSAHRFDFKGQRHPLSDSGINQVIKAITATKLNEGLIAANEAIYKQLTLGITVDEFVGGDKTSVTVPLVEWSNIDANLFHVTEELSVDRPAGMGRYRPDVVCYVNGLPMVVIEAKGAEAADRISGLKKLEMVTAAEDLLAGTGWLPEPLRTPPLPEDDVPAFELVDNVDESASVEDTNASEGQTAEDGGEPAIGESEPLS